MQAFAVGQSGGRRRALEETNSIGMRAERSFAGAFFARAGKEQGENRLKVIVRASFGFKS